MKAKSVLLKGLLGTSMLVLGAQAYAIPVVGSSGGSFSNLSSCYTGDTCRIVSTSNGPATQVQWGSVLPFFDFVQPSTLTAVDLSINLDTAVNGSSVALARLDWYNSATLATNDLASFNVRWSLSLSFTSPNGPDGIGGESFDLTISNPINPTGDSMYGLGLADLTNLANSFSLYGVSVTNLRYAVQDGAGAGTSYLTNVNGGRVWYNSENNWSSLYILADFIDLPASVPEPGSLALFGLGLLGVAAAVRRRRAAR
jgi:hypothetical protein